MRLIPINSRHISKRALLTGIMFFLYGLLYTSTLHAASPEVIEVSTHHQGQTTGDDYYYLVDKTNTLSLSDVIASSNWTKSEPNITNRGFTSASSWMKFTLKNSSQTNFNIILEYVESSVGSIDVYHRKLGSDEEFTHSNFTFSAPVETREVSFYRPAFELSLPYLESHEVYVRIFPGDEFPMHSFTAMRIWDQASFYLATHIELTFLVILLCTELFMGFATLLVFFISRDKMFLYYSIFAFSIASLFASLSGVWGYFFARENYQLWMVVFQISLSQIAAIWFVRCFLNIRQISKMIDNALLAAIAVSIVGVIVNLSGYPYYPRLIIDNIAFLYILLVPIGLFAWKKEVPHAGLFTFSWAVFILGMLTASLRLRGYLIDSFWLQWLIYLGGFIEAFLLTTIMVLRLRDMQHAKLKIELTHREHLENYANELSQQVKLQTKQLLEAKEKAETEARVDILTGLTNRRAFIESAHGFLARASRQPGTNLYLLMIDIDHFKKVNDTYGHAAGDAVLVAVANSLSETIRTIDVVSRLGGEEFAALMENKDPQGAINLSERLRKAIEDLVVEFEGQQIKLTTSIGVAKWGPMDNLDTLMNQADHALYQAKESGRNCVYSSCFDHQQLKLV
ncbi:sensor domain-containing diguanylate cyclase [Shewanella nanhaiensis]|uniref:diguanylate cyclase n=1 Tax=Shewanella nanhaiensis TaxID=2864872 RepID=A0ABS7DXH6_9GAMM|nr:diguanylate cyclase [Shewanella nanhaiensis]MBW8182135.1 sensor domain-containing diguanylate cyclase [Shewanella nanhaiensis]